MDLGNDYTHEYPNLLAVYPPYQTDSHFKLEPYYFSLWVLSVPQSEIPSAAYCTPYMIDFLLVYALPEPTCPTTPSVFIIGTLLGLGLSKMVSCFIPLSLFALHFSD